MSANSPPPLSNGKLYYGVFGDTDGDTPEEIGEASWLMANTCFSSEGLNGGKGHTDADVTCEQNHYHHRPASAKLGGMWALSKADFLVCE